MRGAWPRGVVLGAAILLVIACGDDPEHASSSAGGAVAGMGGVGNVGGVGGEGATGGGGDAGMGGAVVELPCVDPNAIAVESVPPAKLSQTGLYSDIMNKTVASYVAAYTPQFGLWADGADKTRFIYLPDCAIGSADMDHWVFAVGTRVWKQFSVDGVPIETRFIHRYGAGQSDWLYAVYQWDMALADADLIDVGVTDANGTSHDIPAQSDCATCHDPIVDRLLGFGAIQLSHAEPGSTMATLSADGKLSAPAPAGFAVPGDAVTRAALGYLHANCGNCHHQDNLFRTKFSARLSSMDATVEATDIYTTAVGAPPSNPLGPGVTHRIAPGDPMASAVWYRMSVRQPFVQMPPLATEVVDTAGLAEVAAWIGALP